MKRMALSRFDERRSLDIELIVVRMLAGSLIHPCIFMIIGSGKVKSIYHILVHCDKDCIIGPIR